MFLSSKLSKKNDTILSQNKLCMFPENFKIVFSLERRKFLIVES
jgi:hypothetical protein